MKVQKEALTTKRARNQHGPRDYNGSVK